MKIFVITLLFVFFSTGAANAQSAHLDLNLAHNWNYLDRDLELSAERFSKNNGLKISLLYFQNTAEETSNWQGKPRATNLAEHLGLSIAYLRYIPLQESNVELYPYAKLSGFNLPYQSHDENLGLRAEPASWKFYSAIGLQVKCKLYRRLYLSGSVDAGGRWEKINYGRNLDFNGLAACGSIGLAYRIKA